MIHITNKESEDNMYCYGCGKRYFGSDECPSCGRTFTVVQPTTEQSGDWLDEIIKRVISRAGLNGWNNGKGYSTSEECDRIDDEWHKKTKAAILKEVDRITKPSISGGLEMLIEIANEQGWEESAWYYAEKFLHMDKNDFEYERNLAEQRQRAGLGDKS